MPKCLGIHGCIGSGKDALAMLIQRKMLQESGQKYHIKKFATQLRVSIQLLTDSKILAEQTYTDKEKERLISPDIIPRDLHLLQQRIRHALEISSGLCFDVIADKFRCAAVLLLKLTEPDNKCTVGKLLQVFGTDIGRKMFDENIWVKAFENLQYNKDENIIVSDLRFPNEMKYLQTIQADLLWIDARERLCKLPIQHLSGRDSLHISETALDDYKPQFMVVDNNGSYQQFKDRVPLLLDQLGYNE